MRRSRSRRSADEADLGDRPESDDAVLPADLLALLPGPCLVSDRHLERPVPGAQELRRELRLDVEPVGPQVEPPEDLGAGHLVTGLEVRDVAVEQDVRPEVEVLVTDDVPEVERGMRPERSRAVHEVGLAGDHRFEAVHEVCRLVLEVCVERDEDVAGRSRQRRSKSGPFATILLVPHEPDVFGESDRGDHVGGPVARPVVDDHDLDLDGEARRKEFLQGGADPLPFVIDRYCDGQPVNRHAPSLSTFRADPKKLEGRHLCSLYRRNTGKMHEASLGARLVHFPDNVIFTFTEGHAVALLFIPRPSGFMLGAATLWARSLTDVVVLKHPSYKEAPPK